MNPNTAVVPFRDNHKILRIDVAGRRGGLHSPPAAAGRIRSRAATVFAALLTLAFALASPLLALNPDLAIKQYLHTSWTQEEGSALPPVQALAQTADGYLWLGTGTGLIRFDGLRFSEWTPPSGSSLPNADIRCLRAAARGGLWVGTTGGLCRIDHGRIVRYPSLDRLPCRLIISMVEDPRQGLWMVNACSNGTTLALLSPNGELRTFGRRDGLPAEEIRALVQDPAANLWIVTTDSICRWSPGRAPCVEGPSLGLDSLVRAANGELPTARSALIPDRGAGGASGSGNPRVPRSVFLPGTVLRDRDGSVWLGTGGEGLLRFSRGAVERFTLNDGLSGNLVSALLQDHEGDLWVATARGIDRFRDPNVVHLSTLDGLSGDLIDATLGAGDGAVWIGTAGGGLDRVMGREVSRFSVTSGLPSQNVTALYQDASQRLWVGTAAGLCVQSGRRFLEVLTAAGRRLDRVFNISGNQSGAVWLADSSQGLFSVNGRIATPVSPPELRGRDIYRLLVARDGAVWMGHFRGGVSVWKNGSVRSFDTRDGLGKPPVEALYEDREGVVWAGTGDGLSRFHDGRWTTWSAAQGLPEAGVQSITEDETGGFWLMTALGVLRVPRASLDGPVKMLSYVLYGRTEGLRLLSKGAMSSPRLTTDRRGRLWLCTEDGVAVIDPARVRSNPIPPPVVIEQVSLDGKALDAASGRELAIHGHDLQIGYTGISLMVPERVRFQYRLANLDRNWTDAGTRRNVAYVNLPPGHYRFEVKAANSDGVWDTRATELPLRVIPSFYQTAWFLPACAISALLVVWCLHRLRTRRLVERYRLIAAERARFGRELHDSLLQGFSGVVFQLEAAARQFDTAPDLCKERLERALNRADESLREARQMIVSMRIPALENSTLPEALKTVMDQIVSGVDFQFEIKGRVRQGPYDLEANIFLIAREAVNNALNHASASRIRLELNYTPKELMLTIADDGAGFDPQMALTKNGHWGFRGMQERTRQMGGQFTVNTAPGRGARITVTAPWKK